MKNLSIIVSLLILIYLSSCTTIQPLAINRNIYSCIDFDNLSSGQTYTHNDVITGNGVSLMVTTTGWTAPTQHAIVDDRHYAQGTGLDLRLNNISVNFQFERTPNTVFFQFADLGGQHHLNINGNDQTLNDLHSLNGQTISGVDISVFADTDGHNWYGVIGFAGNLNQLSVGGQELWIDNVCGVRTAEYIALLDLRTHSNPNTLPEFLIEPLLSILNDNDIATYNHTAGQLNEGLLSDVDILIFFPKRGKMNSQEKNAVRNFISEGGGVLLLGDYAGPNTASIDIYQDLFDVVEAVHEGTVLGSGVNPIVLSSPSFNNHPIIQNISSFEMYAATTISGLNYATIVHTNNYDPSNSPLLIAKDQDNGRVVVSGDATLFYASSLANRDNSQVFSQIVDWLLKKL